MICNILPKRSTNDTSVFLVPAFQSDAWDLYNMLDAAFPYNMETYTRPWWNFHIACAGGYENAVEFVE